MATSIVWDERDTDLVLSEIVGFDCTAYTNTPDWAPIITPYSLDNIDSTGPTETVGFP